MKNDPARPYRLRARADKTAENRERILDAAVALFWERPSTQISLEEVAAKSEVSVRSLIRYFGGREGLFVAAAAREQQRTRDERDEAPVGDITGLVAVLVTHYERIGDRVLALLSEEQRFADLRDLADDGRAVHRAWCMRVFAPWLTGLRGVTRYRRLAQFVTVCDVYTWRLLRRDSGLSRRQTEIALRELLLPLTEGTP